MLANESVPTAARRPRRPLPRRLLRQLGAVSLFYKVLLANGALVLVAALTGIALVGWVVRTAQPLAAWEVAGFAAGVTALSLLVNALVLRAAFLPLQRLEETADAVRRGDDRRRAPHSLLSDPTIARLIDTFNAMLEAQAGQRAELAALSSRTLDAQEEERRRIARELHDETAQELTALLVRIRLAADGSREPATRERLAELRAATARTLDGVRRLARELRPTILDDLGLAEAIRAYAHDTTLRGAARVTVQTRGPTARLDPTRELVLYRVVQEALTNVAKHAAARAVEVTLDYRPDRVAATVADDGRGFEPAVAAGVTPTGQGLGLLGMRERLALVGGALELDAQPGGGTRVRATVPLGSDGGREG
jgi:two-component system sensor histidine kinase UhpB